MTSVVGEEPRPLILVFDSGVGGLSILHEIKVLLPSAGFIYLSDNEAFPYGEMPEKKLVPRVNNLLREVVARYHPHLVVIACNTASTVALPSVRSALAVPVVGVVPAIKPAAIMSRTKTIALLATNATINRTYTLDLITQFAAGCRVIRVGSSALVKAAEAKLRGEALDGAALDDVISRLFKGADGAALDTVVLGCTHFPLLVAELAARAPREVVWIDSGPSIAQRVRTLLPEELSGEFWPADIAIFTKQTNDLLALAPALASYGFHQTVLVNVPL